MEPVIAPINYEDKSQVIHQTKGPSSSKKPAKFHENKCENHKFLTLISTKQTKTKLIFSEKPTLTTVKPTRPSDLLRKPTRPSILIKPKNSMKTHQAKLRIQKVKLTSYHSKWSCHQARKRSKSEQASNSDSIITEIRKPKRKNKEIQRNWKRQDLYSNDPYC